MKKIIQCFLFFILMFSCKTASSQEFLSYLDGRLMFQRPPGVTLWEERPQFNNVNEQVNYWRGKMRITVNAFDAEALKGQPPVLMTQPVYDLAYTKGYLTRNDLLGLFEMKPEFVIYECMPRSMVRPSYKRLTHNGMAIGEAYFMVGSLELNAPGVFSYRISLIVENQIVHMGLAYTITDSSFFNFNAFNDFFTIHDNERYWKDDQSVISFYETLSSANYITLPEPLQQLREAYLLILQTLKIRQDNDYLTDISVISPRLEFQKTHITTDNLRLREREGVDAPTMVILPKGTDVQVLRIGGFIETIDGISAPWVTVTTSDNIVGWVFSGYLSEK